MVFKCKKSTSIAQQDWKDFYLFIYYFWFTIRCRAATCNYFLMYDHFPKSASSATGLAIGSSHINLIYFAAINYPASEYFMSGDQSSKICVLEIFSSKNCEQFFFVRASASHSPSWIQIYACTTLTVQNAHILPFSGRPSHLLFRNHNVSAFLQKKIITETELIPNVLVCNRFLAFWSTIVQ